MALGSMIYADALFRIEMAMASALAPLTGTRATGNATARLLDGQTDDIVLPKNTYGVPCPRSTTGNAFADFTRMVKTTAETTIIAGTGVTTDVPVTSVIGGLYQNLPVGCDIIWYPCVLAGVDPHAVLTAGLTGGADVAADPVTGCPQIRRVVTFEGVMPGNAGPSAWKSGIGDFPAVMIAWESSESGSFHGRASYLQNQKFRIYVIVNRVDGQNARRDDGKAILNAVSMELNFRGGADGETFSAPETKPGSQGRLTMDPGTLWYFVDFTVHHTLQRTERRTWPLLTNTVETLITFASTGLIDDEIIVVDSQEQDQTLTP